MKGVSELITSLPTFMGTFSFFGDELHMIGHGLGHLVSNLLDPQENSRFKVEGSNEYTFDFQQANFFKRLPDLIKESKCTSPTSFDFSFNFKKAITVLLIGSFSCCILYLLSYCPISNMKDPKNP